MTTKEIRGFECVKDQTHELRECFNDLLFVFEPVVRHFVPIRPSNARAHSRRAKRGASRGARGWASPTSGVHEIVAKDRMLGQGRLTVYRFFAGRPFWATAAWIKALNASASSTSPSRMSIARRVLPSRLELKSPRGSSKEAPRANVSLTTCL